MIHRLLKRLKFLTCVISLLALTHPPIAQSHTYQLVYSTLEDLYLQIVTNSSNVPNDVDTQYTNKGRHIYQLEHPPHDIDHRRKDNEDPIGGRFTRLRTARHKDTRHSGSTDQYGIKRRKRDRELFDEIRHELETNPFVDEYDIRVLVLKDVVTLRGVVEDRDAMVAAVESAYEAGARKVKNRLRVHDLEDTPWTDMSDRELKEEIRYQLSTSPWVDEHGISLKVRDGVATLSGIVDDHSAMLDAIENTYQAGARRVINRLQLRH